MSLWDRFKLALADWRWAMNVRRARAWRRDCSFSARVRFDTAYRPRLKEPGAVIAYPDALYHVDSADLARAMEVSREYKVQ